MTDYFSHNPDGPALVIGAAGIDMVGRLRSSELRSNTSNPARIRISFGGVARNVAENLARLGQSVNLISAVGPDHDGDHLLEELELAGVNVQAVTRNPDRPTGTYLGVLDSHGDLQFALDDMRVIAGLTPAYLKENIELFEEASLLFVDANLPKETLRTAISLGRRAHLPICADPATTALASRLRPYLSRLFMVIPNINEAAVLCERSIETPRRRWAIETAKCLVGQGVEIAIISLGEAGVCYATSEISGQIPAIRTEIVDPTGAGDAMAAAVIFALLNDIPIDDAIRLGVSSASLTLRYPGAVLPDLSLEKLYDHLVI